MKKELELYGKVTESVSLKLHTTYKTGGSAKYFLQPNSIENLKNAIKFLKERKESYFILGNGSNLILSDNDYNGTIIKLDLLNHYEIDEDNLVLKADAGVFIPPLVLSLAKAGYSGFEWAGGLPGTIGGAIYANAGAYKVEIADMILDVTILEGNEIKTINREEIEFSYRHSIFKDMEDVVILHATLKLDKGDSQEILAKMKKRAAKRINSQPLEFPSAGSVFRNPDEEIYQEQFEKYNIEIKSAGHLIERCGLKGYQIGGAKVSEKHANFIINTENATSRDIIDLITFIQNNVKEKFEIDLILEQIIVKW